MKKTSPPLDPHFMPMYSVWEKLRKKAERGKKSGIDIACVREDGYCERFDMAFAAPMDETAIRFCERVVKFMLWSSGGYEIYLAPKEGFINAHPLAKSLPDGSVTLVTRSARYQPVPPELTRRIQEDYSPQGARAFDCEMMELAYGRPLTVKVVHPQDMPESKIRAQPLGGHLNGCRLGFDLGASDFKIAAVKDGETVFADEIPWTPVTATDPDYHFNMLQEGLKKAASYLPRVDAIGGSSAGVIVDNQIRVASLIRGISAADRPKAQQLFKRIQEIWKVPMEVANDGDVTALAGAMSLSLKQKGLLGIAMGSSEAAGYLGMGAHPTGLLTGRLNELAFAPVDFNPDAPQDEWSKDIGVGASYFSQQAVNRLAIKAGFTFPADMPLPERLKVVQAAMENGDPAAEKIYTTIGMYLGYTIPWYAQFYRMQNVMILGRVTSGRGGEIIVKTAQDIMLSINPVNLIMPDEKARRVGQCVAAASLPQC